MAGKITMISPIGRWCMYFLVFPFESDQEIKDETDRCTELTRWDVGSSRYGGYGRNNFEINLFLINLIVNTYTLLS